MMTRKQRNALHKVKDALIESSDSGLRDLSHADTFKEALIADVLGHSLSRITSGPDAYMENGTPVEYKSCNPNRGFIIRYTFTSQMETVEEQVENWKETIFSRKYHYWVMFDHRYNIIQLWECESGDVYNELYPLLMESWNNKGGRQVKSFSVCLYSGAAKRIGKQII